MAEQRGGDAGNNKNEARIWATPSFNETASYVDHYYQLTTPAELLALTKHSTVHKSYSLTFGRFVAIKIIDKKSIPSWLVEKFLPRELEITQKVNHQFIVRCLHIYQPHPTKVVILSEFCAGGTLLNYVLDYNGLQEREAARLFRQLIEAVHYLHDTLSIAHRDIKLENILLDQYRIIKLADFGFAREVKPHLAEKSTSYCGTRPYSAPQLVDHQPYNPFAADWFACGIGLYTMIAGRWPYEPWEKISYPIHYPTKISYPVRLFIDQMVQENEQFRAGYKQCCQNSWLAKLTEDGQWAAYPIQHTYW